MNFDPVVAVANNEWFHPKWALPPKVAWVRTRRRRKKPCWIYWVHSQMALIIHPQAPLRVRRLVLRLKRGQRLRYPRDRTQNVHCGRWLPRLRTVDGGRPRSRENFCCEELRATMLLTHARSCHRRSLWHCGPMPALILSEGAASHVARPCAVLPCVGHHVGTVDQLAIPYGSFIATLNDCCSARFGLLPGAHPVEAWNHTCAGSIHRGNLHPKSHRVAAVAALLLGLAPDCQSAPLNHVSSESIDGSARTVEPKSFWACMCGTGVCSWGLASRTWRRWHERLLPSCSFCAILTVRFRASSLLLRW